MPDDNQQVDRHVPYNTRLGLILFTLYLIFYGAFVYLSAFRGDVMARPFLAGVNLAVVYGFALIIGAIVLALIYMLLCRQDRE